MNKEREGKGKREGRKRKLTLRRFLIAVLIPAVLLAGAVVFRACEPPFMEEIQLKVFDYFTHLKPRQYQEVPVRVVDLDDETLEKLGQWPWPRTQVAELVARLREVGVSVIAFDIVFAEPDRTSPAQVLPLWESFGEFDALKAREGDLPDHDKILAGTIAESPVVTGFSLTKEANGKAPVAKCGFAFSGDDPKQYLPDFEGAVVNLPVLEEAASGNGSFTVIAEHDGVIWRVPTLFRLGNLLYPSLAVESLRIAQGARTVMVKSSGGSGELSFGAHTGVSRVKVGQFAIPTDESGNLWLYDTGHVPARTIPAWRIFSGEIEPGTLEGAIVFVGTSAAGLKDLRTTPLDPVAAGVEVHAQIAEQILLGSFLMRPDWADGAEVLFLAGFGVLLVVVMPFLGAISCGFLGLAAIMAALGFSWYAFSNFGWLVDPVYPAMSLFLVYTLSFLIYFLQTESERKKVRNAFTRYMSPVMVARLAEHPELLKLGGETKNMTVLFSDIRGFTTISEQFDAVGLTNFMNRYLTPMTELVLKNGGTIDKYIGDCVMAFWNAPLDDPDHATNACRAALAMRDYLVKWNVTLKEEAQASGRHYVPVHAGYGINTGDCCVGNMGSDMRFDYSVLGDDVNLASRLEGQSKNYGVDIVIGENTFARVGEFATLELDLIKVKGKTRPVRIYAVLGDPSLKETKGFQALAEKHQEILTAYRKQDWKRAKILMRECEKLAPEGISLHKLHLLYESRIETYLVEPPGPAWDGVYEAKTK